MGLNDSIFQMIINAGPMVQLVITILLFFSILSWAIILHKFITFRRISKESRAFLAFVKSHNNLSLCYEAAKRYKTPFSRVFSKAYEEAIRKRNVYFKNNPSLVSYIKDDLERGVKKVINEEVNVIENTLPFLATTGNTTPFIGLFGTVWGIMSSFRGIGIKGSANLAVVAPGISEALIATAMGLFAAIPAVIAYNYYLHKVNNLATEMEDFAEEIMRAILRVFQKREELRVSAK